MICLFDLTWLAKLCQQTVPANCASKTIHWLISARISSSAAGISAQSIAHTVNDIETYSWQVRGVSTCKYIWKHFFKPYMHHEVLGEQGI